MMSPDQFEDFKKLLEDLFSKRDALLSKRDAPLVEVQRAMRALTEQWEQRTAEDQTDERLRAVASAIIRLADGLDTATRSQRNHYNEIEAALVSMLGVSGEALTILRENLDKLTVEQLAKALKHSTVCAVRTWQYEHGDANWTSDNTPAKLPPIEAVVAARSPGPMAPPDPIVAVAGSLSNVTTDDDDSITFRTEKGKAHIRANIKAKTLFGWVVGLVMAGLYLYEKLKPLLGHH